MAAQFSPRRQGRLRAMDTLTHALSGALLARATAPGSATGAQTLKRVGAGVAHVNLRRDEPRTAGPDAGFISRLDAAYQSVAGAAWQTHPRYGGTDVAPVARQAWESPALAFFRWFAAVPAFDGATAGSACVWFIDLRFLTPGRGSMPFRFGACREGDGPWRAHERTSDNTWRRVE